MRWVGNVARMGDRRGACRFWWKKPEGQKLLWRPQRRWEENMTTYVLEIG